MDFLDDFDRMSGLKPAFYDETAAPKLVDAAELTEADAFMTRCVVDVMKGGKSKNAAFSICMAQGQKSGIYEKGTRKVTPEGAGKVSALARKPDHDEKMRTYNQLVVKKKETKEKIAKKASDKEKELRAAGKKGKQEVSESRDLFTRWLGERAEQRGTLVSGRMLYTVPVTEASSVVSFAEQVGASVVDRPDLNFTALRFIDGDVTMKIAGNRCAVMLPPMTA